MKTNWLARIFEWLGDVFEKFNPSAFRFLAAVLPYMTPLPVAWLTSASSSKFLGFPKEVAFIFVFTLEGIGLWFTALLVDSVVAWVRSRNPKTFSVVALFALVVTIYVALLVNLNVTLEEATGTGNKAHARVITLLCFLPLLTGIGNGYYKLVLEHKTEVEIARDLEIRKREEEKKERMEIERLRKDERVEKYKIKHGKFQKGLESSSESSRKVSEDLESSRKVPDWRKLRPSLSQEKLVQLAGLNPEQIRQYAAETGFTYKTISNWRTNARLELEQHD